LLFFIIIFSLTTFSSNYKKRKRQTENNILNSLEDTNNTQDHHSPITVITILPNTTINLQISEAIVPFDLLNNILLKTPNLFRYIFAYLSLFDLELNFKCISSEFYNLYEKTLHTEKNLLKENLKNETNFLENINHVREHFDLFEKRKWSNPNRIEYANVDYFSENIVLFRKGIRQIILFTLKEIKYQYVVFTNGYLTILKKQKEGRYFVFTSFENDFQHFEHSIYPNYTNQSLKTFSFQYNVRWIEFCDYMVEGVGYNILLHKTENFKQFIGHYYDKDKICVCKPRYQFPPRLFLKNISGFLHFPYDSKTVSLVEFKKYNNGFYRTKSTHAFQTNVEAIQSKDFQHYADDVIFTFKTD